jgi:hypothetical protein
MSNLADILVVNLSPSDGAEFVRLARRIDLALPGCADGACPLAAFVDRVSAALPSECVWPE